MAALPCMARKPQVAKVMAKLNPGDVEIKWCCPSCGEKMRQGARMVSVWLTTIFECSGCERTLRVKSIVSRRRPEASFDAFTLAKTAGVE